MKPEGSVLYSGNIPLKYIHILDIVRQACHENLHITYLYVHFTYYILFYIIMCDNQLAIYLFLYLFCVIYIHVICYKESLSSVLEQKHITSAANACGKITQFLSQQTTCRKSGLQDNDNGIFLGFR